jgi:hypothetical protein
MTQSEFVRTMVQAGRRGVLSENGGKEPSGAPSSDADPEGERVERVVVESLTEDGPLDWDELVDRLVADVEDRLDDTLASLQDENRLRYSGRDGGYVLTDE